MLSHVVEPNPVSADTRYSMKYFFSTRGGTELLSFEEVNTSPFTALLVG